MQHKPIRSTYDLRLAMRAGWRLMETPHRTHDGTVTMGSDYELRRGTHVRRLNSPPAKRLVVLANRRGEIVRLNDSEWILGQPTQKKGRTECNL